MVVDIYINEVIGASKREIRIPWLPDEISVDTGEATMASYDIMNRGEVAVPTGVGLSTYSWESIFPGVNRTDKSLVRGTAYKPSHYDDILKYWKLNGVKLRLMVTGYPINEYVYLVSYTSKPSGGFGDLAYSLTFKEARGIHVSSAKNNQKTVLPSLKRATSTSDTTTYTVKSGDTLWAIAKAKLGSGLKWGFIYSANKTVIEETAKKHGRSSSGGGHFIYPGTKLLIK